MEDSMFDLRVLSHHAAEHHKQSTAHLITILNSTNSKELVQLAEAFIVSRVADSLF